MTIHNEAKKEEIAKNVIMPGDPLRAKYIAEKYLENPKLVNKVRNIFAYTGKYKGKDVTVMASGMGIPSIGIYATELYKFYDVQNIIRVGTSGSLNKNIKVTDILLVESAYSLSMFNKAINGEDKREYSSTKEINEKLELTAKELNIEIKKGRIVSSEVFESYYDNIHTDLRNKEFLASEMEAFALFFLAKYFNKQASCLLTITDSSFEEKNLSSEERQKSLDKMILLALESLN